MSAEPPSGQESDLQQRRGEIFRGLTLINSLNLGIVILVAALGIIAILLGIKARDDAQKLWNASVTQARASRFGGEIGWRSNALQTIARASEVRPSLALRNEAIAALATPDIDLLGSWHQKFVPDAKLAFSPDLRHIALGRATGSIEILDAKTGAEIRALKMTSSIVNVAFDQSSTYIGARDRTARATVWRADTGAEVLSVRPTANAQSFHQMTFASNSIVLALPGGRMQIISLHDSSSRREIATELEFDQLGADPSGAKLVVARDKAIQIWDIETGARTHQFTSPGNIFSIAASSGADRLAVGSHDYLVYLWRTSDGAMQTLAGHQGAVFRVAFDSSDQRLVSCAFGGTTRFWDVASGSLLLGTESLFVERFGVQPNSFACTRTEAGFGLAQLSDSALTRTLRLPPKNDDPIHWMTFISENIVLASRSEAAQVVDINSGQILAEAPGQRARGGGFNPQESALYTTGSDGLRRWAVTQTPTNSFALGPPEKIPLEKNPANEGLRIAADGSDLLVRIGFTGAALVDTATKKTTAFFPCPNIGGLAISPNKEWIATGTFHGDGTKIWNRNGTLLKNLGGRDSETVFSPDGRWFATISSDLCIVYDTATWQEQCRYPMNSASGLPAVAAFSPDSKILAFSAMRRTIKLIDPFTGTELASLIPPEPQLLNGIAFSPSGDRLVACAHRGAFEIWELADLRGNLAALKLDWRDPSSAPNGLSREQNIFKWVALVAGSTLIAVLGYSFISWVRHRQFVRAYRQIESMIEQRNQQLAAAQAELFQSQKMQALGTLAAGVAHDFNNLLSVIRLSNQLTTEATSGNTEAQENARIIDRAIVQGKTVVRSMLGYSRTSADQKNYSVPDVIEQTVALLRQQFLEKIEVKIASTQNIEPVFGSENHLEQILLNLIVNAVEAMKGEGSIRISIQMAKAPATGFLLRPIEDASYVQMTVADTGPGMPPETVARIFEPFFTTKNVGKERGTGLGLSLVYGICKENGIGIAVKSEPGAGSEFHLFIPTTAAKSGLPSADGPAIVGV